MDGLVPSVISFFLFCWSVGRWRWDFPRRFRAFQRTANSQDFTAVHRQAGSAVARARAPPDGEGGKTSLLQRGRPPASSISPSCPPPFVFAVFLLRVPFPVEFAARRRISCRMPKRLVPDSKEETAKETTSVALFTPSNCVYDLEPIRAPRLHGTPLRMFVKALEAPLLPSLLVPKILADSGFAKFERHHVPPETTVSAHPLANYEPPPLDHLSSADVAHSGRRVRQKLAPHAPAAETDASANRFQTNDHIAASDISAADLSSLFDLTSPPYHALWKAATATGATLNGSDNSSPAARKPSVLDYFHLYQTGSATPLSIAETIVAEITRLNRPLNALIFWDAEDILQQAAASADRWKDKKPLSPLDGVPVVVKDNTDVYPYPTSGGTLVASRLAKSDATTVARLRAAGAILLGKSNMHELGIGITGHNAEWKVSHNPYAPDFHTGGSSAGSAAAVGAGLCPVAVGTDGGGSIRLPASMCGCVGLKPTFGRVSRGGDMAPDASIVSVGPITETVADCLCAYMLMAGHDAERDPVTTLCSEERPVLGQADVQHFLASASLQPRCLAGLKIGIFPAWFNDSDERVRVLCRQRLDYLANDLGAEIVEIGIPSLQAARWAHAIIITSDLFGMVREGYDENKDKLLLETRVALCVARRWTAQDLLKAQRIRTQMIDVLNSIFTKVRQCDVIATPTMAIPVPQIPAEALPGTGELSSEMQARVMQYAFLANLTGHPAISVPVGCLPSPDGEVGHLPVGLQFVAGFFQEAVLFRVAFAAATAVGAEPLLKASIVPSP